MVRFMSKKIVLLLVACGLGHAGEADRILNFLKDMLVHSKFENYAFLNTHCTEKMLKKLESDYDYECDDGPCYAVWDFREGASDVWEWKILEVKPESDGWFSYTFQENDVVRKHRILAREVNGVVMLFDLER